MVYLAESKEDAYFSDLYKSGLYSQSVHLQSCVFPESLPFFAFIGALYEVLAYLIHKINLNWKLDELLRNACRGKELEGQ